MWSGRVVGLGRLDVINVDRPEGDAMRSKSLLRLPALLLVLMLVLAAGCGGSDSNDDAASDDDSTEQTDATNGDSDDDGDDNGDTPTPSGDGDAGTFCRDFRAVLDEYLSADDLFTNEERWNSYYAALESLDPPAVIAADWRLILDGFNADEEPEGTTEAYENVDAWVIQECGFDPDDPGLE